MSKSTSATQIGANRKNAEKSTGPKTPEGKQAAACNAVKHSLSARQLILNDDDEDPTEYQALVDGLEDALSPVGALEYALVERIAVTLWRQRRLVRAESAAIELNRQDRGIAKSVSNTLEVSPYSDEAIKEDDLQLDVVRKSILTRWSHRTMSRRCSSTRLKNESRIVPPFTDAGSIKL